MENFFANSALLEYFATKPLSHIRANWELTWNKETNCYEIEEDSFDDTDEEYDDTNEDLKDLVVIDEDELELEQ